MNKTLYFLLLFALPFGVWALSSDAQQQIEITANSANIDDAKGVTIYSGEVKIIQGTTQISADKVTLHYDQAHNIETVHAEGKPARFERQPDHRKDKIYAQALRMEYHLQKDMIHLYDNAQVHQGKDTFTGDKIRWDIQKELITADGKVSVTIQPKGAATPAVPQP